MLLRFEIVHANMGRECHLHCVNWQKLQLKVQDRI